MTRHRPRYVLWTTAGPVAVCDCHYGTPVHLDRQLPLPAVNASTQQEVK